MKSLLPIISVISSLLLLSCESTSMGGYAFKPESYRVEAVQTVSDGYWDRPEHVKGTHKIIVDISMQNAKYYIGDTQVGYTMVSTGKEGKQTPRATYRVLSKDIDHRSSKYGKVVDADGNDIEPVFVVGEDKMPAGGKFIGSSMAYGLQLNHTGIWMHEGIVTSAPESAGCIRVPTEMAKIFYENAPVGTLVIVR